MTQDEDLPDCEETVEVPRLEGVTQADFFLSGKGVPPEGTEVWLKRLPTDGRLQVVTAEGEAVGFLPGQFDDLLRCIAQGVEYQGSVSHSAHHPVPLVQVELKPVRRRNPR